MFAIEQKLRESSIEILYEVINVLRVWNFSYLSLPHFQLRGVGHPYGLEREMATAKSPT
jgi:hypothetical protein